MVDTNMLQFCVFLFLEPISGTAPKVPFVQQRVQNTIATGQSLAILCPAQAYPVPNFRYFWSQVVVPYSDIQANEIVGFPFGPNSFLRLMIVHRTN